MMLSNFWICNNINVWIHIFLVVLDISNVNAKIYSLFIIFASVNQACACNVLHVVHWYIHMYISRCFLECFLYCHDFNDKIMRWSWCIRIIHQFYINFRRTHVPVLDITWILTPLVALNIFLFLFSCLLSLSVSVLMVFTFVDTWTHSHFGLVWF